MKRWQKIVGIVIVALIAAIVVLSFVLDGILTSKAREQAQKLSAEWGRPVQIGSVATKFLTGLGVRVSEPAESEPGLRSAFVTMTATHGLSVQLVELARVEPVPEVAPPPEAPSSEPEPVPAAAQPAERPAPIDLTPDEWSDVD